MSDKIKVRIVVLWEREIRIAAKMCAQAEAAIAEIADEKPIDGEAARLIFEAFKAASIALFGAEDSDSVLMISAHQIGDVGERETETHDA